MAKALGRFRCSDALGVRSTRVRDQENEGEEQAGRVLCRIVEGRDGNLHIMDAGRLRLRARRGRDGTLEILHREDEDEDEDERTGDESTEAPAENGDPREQVTGAHPGLGGNSFARAAATTPIGDAMAAFYRTGDPTKHMSALASYQRRLDDFYRR